MFRHELSAFLLQVLDTVERCPRGLSVDASGEPELATVDRLARHLDAKPEDVRQALIGLRAAYCLLEESVEFPGIEPVVRWVVHPQCVS